MSERGQYGPPNDAAVGLAFGTIVGDNSHLIVGVAGTNGVRSDPFQGFDNSFSDHEYFTSIELGYTSSHERIVFDNYHVALRDEDKQAEASIPSGWA